jgi:2-acylglycerol O-acyltransferase 2
LIISISVIYCCWLFFDRERALKGGRWCNYLRECFIWKEWIKYFPISLIKSDDLDPNLNYIIGYHPHGVGSFGALGNFCTDATGFSNLFPRIRPHLMLLRIQFFNPITRDLLLGLGKKLF